MSRDIQAAFEFFSQFLLFVAWPEALALSAFNSFLFLQLLVGLTSGVSRNFVKLPSHEMDRRIKEANQKDSVSVKSEQRLMNELSV